MITVTLNPALDLSTSTPSVVPAHKLRCAEPLRHPGGGGINVARVLHRLGEPVLALYLAGGLMGEQLAQLLAAEGVPTHAIPIAGETRASFAVVESGSGREFRFVMPGPTLTEAEWQGACSTLAAHAPVGGWVVLSGSLPPGAPADAYVRMARIAQQAGSRVALDSSGPALTQALLAGGIDLVKPSLRELGELLGLPLDDEDQWLRACRELVQRGQTRRVALSLGSQGALLVDAQGAWRADALSIDVASTTGAGDSFLAALCAADLQGLGSADALRLAVAAGSAALLQPGTALCTAADMGRLVPQVRVRAL